MKDFIRNITIDLGKFETINGTSQENNRIIFKISVDKTCQTCYHSNHNRKLTREVYYDYIKIETGTPQPELCFGVK